MLTIFDNSPLFNTEVSLCIKQPEIKYNTYMVFAENLPAVLNISTPVLPVVCYCTAAILHLCSRREVRHFCYIMLLGGQP
jgi:hypothetical protein